LFGFNHTGLNHLTKNTKSEVIYASYHNDLSAKPFAIFLNHEQHSVVITIRGSLSLEDVITDVNSDPIEMTAAGERWGFDGRGRFAHGGFLNVALSIREEIEESKVLKNLLPQHPLSSNSFRDSDAEYKLEEVRDLSDLNYLRCYDIAHRCSINIITVIYMYIYINGS
jgi:hypothetical protein